MAFALVVDNAAVGRTITPSTQANNYPASNLLRPFEPTMPWRTTATTEQTAVIDLGSAFALGRIILLGLNYATLTLQANATDSWGAPTYTSGTLTAERNLWTQRTQRCIWVAPLVAGVTPSLRYVRLVIAAQTPTDGATYFSSSGIILGAAVALPSGGIRIDPVHETLSNKREARTPSGRVQSQVFGEPYALLRYRRQALTSVSGAFDLTAIEAWKEIDRRLEENVGSGTGWCSDKPWEAFIVRLANTPRWPLSYPNAIDDLVLEEMR